MSICGLIAMHELRSSLKISQPKLFWQTSGRAITSNPICFPLQSNLQFYWTVETCSSNWAQLKLSSDSQLNKNDYDCYVWMEQNEQLFELNDHPIELDQLLWFPHNYNDIQLHCKIVFKKECFFCEQKAVWNEKISNLMVEKEKLKTQNQELKAEIAGNISNSTVELNRLVGDLERERDGWKEEARRLKWQLEIVRSKRPFY